LNPVAITGVGVVCGLGADLDQVSRGLQRNEVGHLSDDSSLLRSAIVPRHAPETPKGFEDDRKVAWLMSAVKGATKDEESGPSDRKGVFLGTGLSSVTPRELEQDVYPHVCSGRIERASVMRDLGADGVAPWRHMPERATAEVARIWGATGPILTAFSACAAGAEAIAEAARSIARGEIDVALAGAHDAMAHPLGMLSFQVLGAMSATTGRPFDRRRDGFVLGEGAAVLRLERAEFAREPLGYILGAGSSIDAWGVTAPHPEGAGAELSMKRALADAGLTADQVDWVNAHATGTPVGDRAEAQAIARVFGSDVPVSSLKGALGHVLAAAGAVEAAATLAGLRDGFIPGTVGCEELDNMNIDVVMESRKHPIKIALSNSFGFGGQNCSLVMASASWGER